MNSSLLLVLTVFLMFGDGHCYSESMSCSTVNGRMVCEKQSGSGNTAGAISRAFSGQDNAYQDSAAMAGNTWNGQSQSSRTVVDGHNTFRQFGVPIFNPNNNAGWMQGSQQPGHLTGTGASDATSFRSDAGQNGISASGFKGTSNNNGVPGPAFGGFAVADSSGNRFYGGGNAYGGGYPAYGGAYPAYGGGYPAYGGGYPHGDPYAFDAARRVFEGTGLGYGFPFNVFGKRR